MPIPKRLGRPPFIEAIFEIRFGTTSAGPTEILPGILFQKLSPWFSEAKHTALGIVPPELLKREPQLAYAGQIQLVGVERVLQLGPQVVNLHRTTYSSWKEFREECSRVAAAVRETNLMGSPERFSLKYVNIIEHSANEPRSAVKIAVDAPGFVLSPNGFMLRFETVIGSTTSIVECASGAESKSTPRRTGLMLAIDTIRTLSPEAFWEKLPGLLDESHSILEDVFFGLVSESSLASFEPIWE